MTARSQPQVQIGQMDTVIEFEPEVITATPPQFAAPGAAGDDVSRLRELLRPIIVDLLEDELSTYMRRRG